MGNPIREVVRHAYKSLYGWAPTLYYFIHYKRASDKLGNQHSEKRVQFEKFLSKAATQKRCLQVGVKESYGKKFEPNWVSVDRYDDREFIDYHYDVQDLQFEDGEFDAVACISILEHVPDPLRAIDELRRVLKPGCEIWVQLPLNYPYHAGPHDYWRASPSGLRVWMRDFTELSCGNFRFARTPLVTSTYFYGRKPLAT